ncbi:MAG TPA: M23 family metallopeptidase [Membranihabitans sp.]|nr:M23 family metallopeptidase [Membranihabitans sp.]
MNKEKFVFNPETLQFDKVKKSTSKTFLKIAVFLSLSACFGYFSFNYLGTFIPELKLKEQRMSEELEQMKVKFNLVNERLAVFNSVLGNIHSRNSNIHEILFGTKPMDDNVWNGGIGGHRQYDELIDFDTKELLVKTLNNADAVSRKLSLQSIALDKLEEMTMERENILNSTPSIKPVQESKLARDIDYLSGFGMRIHPIHKIPKFHKGIDFTAPQGTKIQATGDGVVEQVENKSTGYGLNISINHGYGYVTRYAHLNEIMVKEGQKVKKGEVIGLIGDTGTSTAPHLHYEVHFNGKAVNPIQYVMDGLTPAEYSQLVQKASESNKSLD